MTNHVRVASPWAGLALLLMLLFLGAVSLLELQRDRMLGNFAEEARDDLQLIGFFVRDALQQQDYQRIDSLLDEWGERRKNTYLVRLTAANGFVLGEFKREGRVQEPLVLHTTIPYSYQGLATLELTRDQGWVSASLNRLRIELILGVILIGVVLWHLVLLQARQRERTMALRVQTQKLDRANARLRDAADEMQEMRSFLRNILDSMPSILVGVDRAGRVTHWNMAAEKAAEVSAGEAIGRPFVELLPWLQSQLGRLQEAIHSGRSLRADRLVIRHGDELRYSEVMIYPLVASEIRGAVLRVDDITNRIRIEQMMVQTEKMMTVGGLAAGMAHEINNPLSGVLQSCQNILRRLSPELDANRRAAEELGIDLSLLHQYLERRGITGFLDAIRDAAERASRIVLDMLSFSRRSISEFAPVQAREMLESVVRLAASDYDLKKRYDFKRIHIVRDYDPELEPVPCDRIQIEQVLLNLVKNAAHAMVGREDARVPQITLRTRREAGYACIEVEDNGPGMDEKTLQRVFEPFFTTKQPGVGTGLGLSVSYFIVNEQHKGSIAVESKVGVGTRFVIRLPLQRAESGD